MISLNEAAEQLKAADDILVLSHQFPDGDTLGSNAALCRALQKLGKRVRFACSDEVSKKFAYLFDGMKFEEFDPKFVVSVDIADVQLFGNGIASYADQVDLCIDHHKSNVHFAKASYVDSTASATCEILYDLIHLLGVNLDSAMADCIYTGIATDTGCFKYVNVTPRTFRIAAELMEIGIHAVDINRAMFDTKSLARLELERRVIESLSFHLDGRCAVSEITQKMIRETGATDDDVDGISGIPRQIEGVLIGISIREKQDGAYKISVRTHSSIDASVVCAKFGGGGHRGAAGCTIQEPLAVVKKKLVQAASEEYAKIPANG